MELRTDLSPTGFVQLCLIPVLFGADLIEGMHIPHHSNSSNELEKTASGPSVLSWLGPLGAVIVFILLLTCSISYCYMVSKRQKQSRLNATREVFNRSAPTFPANVGVNDAPPSYDQVLAISVIPPPPYVRSLEESQGFEGGFPSSMPPPYENQGFSIPEQVKEEPSEREQPSASSPTTNTANVDPS